MIGWEEFRTKLGARLVGTHKSKKRPVIGLGLSKDGFNWLGGLEEFADIARKGEGGAAAGLAHGGSAAHRPA